MSQPNSVSSSLPRHLHGLGDLFERARKHTPELRFGPEHLVRRAVREYLGISGLRAFMPHMQGIALPTEQLFALLDEQERLEIKGLPETPWTYFVPQPDTHDLKRQSAEQALNELWRTLFHLACDRRLAELVSQQDERLSNSAILANFDRLGQLPSDEVREVLAEEGLCLSDASSLTVWSELVSTWHELKAFAPRELKRWFPSLMERPAVEALLSEYFDAEALLRQTRPEGASESFRLAAAEPKPVEKDTALPTVATVIPKLASLALSSSRKALKQELPLSAAIYASRAIHYGSKEEGLSQQAHSLQQAGEDLVRLYPQAENPTRADEWVLALEPLLVRAQMGMVRVEARLLHDLQTACQDSRHERLDLNLGRYLRSFGRRPLRRSEPIRAEVGIVRNLRKAHHRVSACRLNETERRRLSRLLGDLANVAETKLRQKLAPILTQALEDAGLVPQNLPERVAQESIVSALLDLLLKRGFLVFSDLRDFVARNQLKLADLSGLGEWFKGDQLLRLNTLLAERLDGAYRGAEFHLKALQRLTSVFYGTGIGRLLVRFLILPLGGAFFLVQGLEHMFGPLLKLFMPSLPPLLPGVEAPHLFWSLESFFATTALLFLLLHSAPARKVALGGARAIGRAFHTVFVSWPRKFRHWRPIAYLIETKAFYLLWRGLLLPALVVALPAFVTSLFVKEPHKVWLYGALPLVLILGAWCLSRPGERALERLAARLLGSYGYIKDHLIPGLIQATLAFFKRVLEVGEIGLYRVDEWLRIRRGDSSLSFVLKLVFGFIWSIFAYIVRLMINLVVEPQVNPIKHFPVVTVSHKVTIPMTLTIAQELRPYLGAAAANVVGGIAQFIIPGICGFLVWEFKENWRLYAANRQRDLKPVLVGSHGETVPRLLRLGFHSGTIPRLFRDLRKAGRRGDAHAVRTSMDELHHVEEAVETFLLRELKTLLLIDGRLPHMEQLSVSDIRITPARIAFNLNCPPLGQPARLHFEEQSGWLVAQLLPGGFPEALEAGQKTLFEQALRGLYKLAGVDMVRSQVEALLPMEHIRYDISARGLIVRPRSFKGEWRYPLRDKATLLTPEVFVPSNSPLALPTLRRDELLFQAQPFAWKSWLELWKR